MVIAMANHLGLILHQVDIKGAYLNSILQGDKVLYLRQPPGYLEPGVGMQVLRLQKALYSLKQAGWCWYQTFTVILEKLGFSQCLVDQAIYHQAVSASGGVIIAAVHVDDCIIAASKLCLVDAFKAGLSEHVEVTDLRELHWMLRIEVKQYWAAGMVHLSQRVYIDSILHCFNFTNLKLLLTPMDVQAKLMSEQAPASAAEFAAM